jgi:hypothetical protein
MEKNDKRRRHESRCDGHWEADVDGKRHVAGGEWMMRKKGDHADQRGEVDG